MPNTPGSQPKNLWFRNVWLIAKREMITKMRNKAYILGTLAVVLGVIGLAFFASRANDDAVSDAMIPEFARTQMALQAQAEEEVMAQYGLDAEEVRLQVAVRFNELWTEYQEENPDSGASVRYWIGFGVGILLFLAITMTGAMIAQVVAEEKSSRIVEILLSSMSSFELMVGKIIGIAVVGLVQLAIILLAGYAAARGFGLMGDIFAGINIGSAIWLAIAFFIVGYFSYATLYAAFASTVSRAEEVNVAIQPVMYVLLVPYMAVVIPAFSAIEPLRFVLTYLPLFSPIAAPVYYFQGEINLWQALISLGISLLALPLIMFAAARIYRRSVLATGAKLKILTVLRSNKD
ncbi:ABC transporter permease [Candidatus Saccharibacteria bacterium]|nr:ABC transporter permease [Candidatus Saccharibacteria bacterium]